MNTTYWLYSETRILTAVRVETDATDDHVRETALRQHDLVPLVPPEYTPAYWRGMLERATIRS